MNLTEFSSFGFWIAKFSKTYYEKKNKKLTDYIVFADYNIVILIIVKLTQASNLLEFKHSLWLNIIF